MKTILTLIFALTIIGCETPQSTWNVKDTIDVIQDEQQGQCFFDGFDVICLIPGPPGKDGKDGATIVGADGKDGRDGETKTTHIITRSYIVSSPDVPEPVTYEISVIYEPEPEPVVEPEPVIDEIDVVEVIRPEPDTPTLPTKVSCGGETCHVVQREDGYHVITEYEGFMQDDGSWVLDAAGYQRWLAFLHQLVNNEIQQ